MLLSTTDISNLMYPTLDTKTTAQLCKNGDLYAWKDPNASGVIKPWVIPSESFVLFLKKNKEYLDAFYELEAIGEDTVKLKKKLIHELQTKSPITEERYTYAQLSLIFDVPVNTIVTWFKPYTHFSLGILLFPGRQDIWAVTLMRFLDEHPERHHALEERHGMLLASGALEESAVRHVLMEYAYHCNH